MVDKKRSPFPVKRASRNKQNKQFNRTYHSSLHLRPPTPINHSINLQTHLTNLFASQDANILISQLNRTSLFPPPTARRYPARDMERQPQPPHNDAPQHGNAQYPAQNATLGPSAPMMHGPPQLPPQMFTTAAQLLDLTDSMFPLSSGLSKERREGGMMG